MRGKTAPPPDDRSIVALFRAGDERAVAETEKKYGALLRSAAWSILRSDEDCAECMNDLWLQLYQKLPEQPVVSLPAYAMSAIRHIAINRWHADNARKRWNDLHAQSLEELAQIVGTADTTEEEVLCRELSRLINEFLCGLDRRGRAIFIGRYYESLTAKEIGDKLGMTESGVLKALKRQKLKLKQLLERNGFGS